MAALLLATRVAYEQSASRHSFFECCDWLATGGVSGGGNKLNNRCGGFFFVVVVPLLSRVTHASRSLRVYLRWTEKHRKISPDLRNVTSSNKLGIN